MTLRPQADNASHHPLRHWLQPEDHCRRHPAHVLRLLQRVAPRRLATVVTLAVLTPVLAADDVETTSRLSPNLSTMTMVVAPSGLSEPKSDLLQHSTKGLHRLPPVSTSSPLNTSDATAPGCPLTAQLQPRTLSKRFRVNLYRRQHQQGPLLLQDLEEKREMPGLPFMFRGTRHAGVTRHTRLHTTVH